MKDNQGFSLIEIVLSLSILSLVFLLTQSQFQHLNRQVKSSEISLEARNLLDQILSELRNSEEVLPHLMAGNSNLSFVRCFHRLTHPKANAVDNSTHPFAVLLPRGTGSGKYYENLRSPSSFSGNRICPDEDGFESHITFDDHNPEEVIVNVITLYPPSRDGAAPVKSQANALEARIRVPKPI